MLVDGLSGERIRWEETVHTLDGQFDCLPGDCVLATAFISYVGPFVSDYREELMELWKNEVSFTRRVRNFKITVLTLRCHILSLI